MSDIIERLHAATSSEPTVDEALRGPWLYAEAAAEITRLRAERDALRTLLAECKPYVEYEREARERELMFAGGIASVISRATHERDACDALLDRIDAAMQEVRK